MLAFCWLCSQNVLSDHNLQISNSVISIVVDFESFIDVFLHNIYQSKYNKNQNLNVVSLHLF